ncbi:MAG: DUF4124 domain-containing protein [Candidatus Accumulibacter phosphatis]|jgi:hypothetical protein|uniref:DUF4124 domain-containing protein n=2 Tax=Candidatus Accumulibacter TaxID=327159 RepID=A0A080LT10_9PROT|nr:MULTISPECIES: DUF4124 domain-containing protein [Candidatus Accumulibacter]KFB71602.1 MAG: hypothetical protein AW09_003253 [Candidatus Accumulibacter phosphatis]NMQ07130.1 DUF4124 domain-containing protein [Candidatus Accumulibacter contiguus]HRF11037.1 DUF4124 domain-containing protein [Candidatus Accumulibacter phosphatis]
MHPQALFLVLFVVATAASGSGVYKWVDEKGVTHFSELPPPGQPAQKPQKAPGAQDQPAAAAAGDGGQPAGKTWQQKEAEFRQRQIDREAAARKQEEQEAAVKRQQRDCMLARKRLENLQDANAVSRYDDQGERVYLNDKERTALIQRRRQEIEARCAGM